MPKTVLNIHPKLFVSVATGVGLAVVAAASERIDPTLFTHLGLWATPAAALVTAALGGLAGWLKSVDEDEGDGSAEDVEQKVQPIADAVVPAVAAAVAPVVEKAEDAVAATVEPVVSEVVNAATPAAAPVAAPAATPAPAPAVQSNVIG